MNRINPFQKYYDLINNKTKRPTFPYLIDIELTNKCNLSCSFCRRNDMEREQGMMSDDTFEFIVHEVENKDCSLRFIRWGEPTLHKNIVEYVKYATLKNIDTHLTTNGTAPMGVYKNLIDAGLCSIIFSFQGATENQHELMRGGLDTGYLSEVVHYVETYRADCNIPFIQVSSTMTDADSQDDIDVFKQSWGDIADAVVIGRTMDYEEVKDGEPCYDPNYKLAIDWNGDITACCADYDSLLTIGNISEMSILDAWNSDIIKKWRAVLGKGLRSKLHPCDECKKAY